MDKKRRVGLLTFYLPINYGAVLQTYALNKVLNEYSYVEIIDYRDEDFVNRYGIIPYNWKKKLKRIIYPINTFKIVKNRIIFTRFIKNNCKLSKKYRDKELTACNLEYDMVFVGSDQVWKPSHELPRYLLDFFTGAKYSYAASLGRVNLDESMNVYKQVYKDNLPKFSKISVREKGAVEMLKKEFGVDAVNVLDPVFLVDKPEWEKLANKANIKEGLKEYLFVYLTQVDDEILNYIHENYQDKQIKFITLTEKYNKKLIKKYKFELISKPTPYEWLYLIKNSNEVFTNSFHGSAFSLIFNKRISISWLKAPVKSNCRLENIVEKFNLESRVITNPSFKMNEELNWKDINMIINTEKAKSLEYLEQIFM